MITASPAAQISAPCFSPDGRQLAYSARAEGYEEVHVCPARGGRSRRLTFLGAGRARVAAWQPDGGAVVFATDAKMPSVHADEALWVVQLSGGNAVPLDVRGSARRAIAAPPWPSVSRCPGICPRVPRAGVLNARLFKKTLPSTRVCACFKSAFL